MSQEMLRMVFPNKVNFFCGEQVLCFYGGALYEAKIIQCMPAEHVLYYIHYTGWSKKWDEWVPEYKLLKLNETNLKQQETLFQKLSKTSNRNKKAIMKIKKRRLRRTAGKHRIAYANAHETGTSTPSDSEFEFDNSDDMSPNYHNVLVPRNYFQNQLIISEELSLQKPRIDEWLQKTMLVPSCSQVNGSLDVCTSFNNQLVHVNANVSHHLEVSASVRVPKKLHLCICADHTAIVYQRKLLRIPADIPVRDIVDQYLLYKLYRVRSTRSNDSTHLMVKYSIQNVIDYFDNILEDRILYNYEKLQYKEIRKKYPNRKPSQIYGGFHLLRVFAENSIIKGLNLSSRTARNLEDFLKYLVNNIPTYFKIEHYVNS